MTRVFPKNDTGMFIPPGPMGDFDVLAELEKVQLILTREIKNLLIASSSGKLLPAHSRDLCAYVKLLTELKKEQVDALANSTDEELLKLKGE